MIRGGVEYNLGIFITGVDKDSVADRAGLMVSVILFTLRKMFWRKEDYLLAETRYFVCLNSMHFLPVTDHQFFIYCTFS